ncbi:RNA-binding protein [Candidatus Woesearchaeota archaeon]|nr:RNA-binding protein [Candidatus Woesearchaeota archaeon]
MDNVTCNSCKTELVNQSGSTVFKCPSCGAFDIVRCFHCRQIASKYKCNGCGFEGPS